MAQVAKLLRHVVRECWQDPRASACQLRVNSCCLIRSCLVGTDSVERCEPEAGPLLASIIGPGHVSPLSSRNQKRRSMNHCWALVFGHCLCLNAHCMGWRFGHEDRHGQRFALHGPCYMTVSNRTYCKWQQYQLHFWL